MEAGPGSTTNGASKSAPSRTKSEGSMPTHDGDSGSRKGRISKVSPPGDAEEWESDNTPEEPALDRIGTAPAATISHNAHPSGSRPRNLNREVTYSFDEYGPSSESSGDEAGIQKIPSVARANDTLTPGKTTVTREETGAGAYSKFSVGNKHFRTKGRVSKQDGRLNLSINETLNSGYLAKALSSGIRNHFFPHDGEDSAASSISERAESVYAPIELDEIFEDPKKRPKLNIVIIVIGSRGDIQPFIRIGEVLQNDYGHRVRIATHPAFKDFIEKDAGLEFFSVGGNPSELMAFMVKNPGLMPNFETVRAGEIGRRRSEMYKMFIGMWQACVDQEIPSDPNVDPFVADAIIANPPSFAHIHIAERLGIPLHIMFTFPYSPTTKFPHPLANVKQSNVDRAYTNFMSYPLVEMMTWQGLGDLINKFREQSLGIEPVSTLWAPGQLFRLEVPHTYMWSPALVPKPSDWGPAIDIAGFVFLELGSSFKPPDDLAKFLEAGESPVYIGFGSIVVDNPDKFTKMIFEAVKEAGVRALVSKGWGGFGGDGLDVPENILLLENTPHDWLFPKCRAVVHHGGAGTTAIGLKCAKPTMIVPFFGDQPFWGNMVAKARAGAFECIPYKRLTVEKLANGIRECLTDEAQENVNKIAESIAAEGDGAVNAVRSFHRSLPWRGIRSLRCSILENRKAVWRLKGTSIKLCNVAAELLVREKRIHQSTLTLLRNMEWNDFEGPGEPITGGSMAIGRSLKEVSTGLAHVPVSFERVAKKRDLHNQKKQKHEKKLAKKKAAKGEKDAATNGNQGGAATGATKSSTVTRESTKVSALSADPKDTYAEEVAREAGVGLARSAKAFAKSPIELSLAVAQGFHNAPRLYGDSTVRQPRRITGLKSGLLAGRDEFAHGFEDAVTGLVKLPAIGMREHGSIGAVQGFGMGLGGLVLKPLSAVVSPWPFAAKGIAKEYHARRGDPGTNRYIRKLRHISGERELRRLEEADKLRKAAKDRAESNAGKANTSDSTPADANGSTDPNASGAVSESQALHHDDLEAINERLDYGWMIIVNLMKTKQQIRDRGLIGRIKLRRERKKWKDVAALETLETAAQALDSQRQGVAIEEALAENKEEVDRANRPRLPTMMQTQSTAARTVRTNTGSTNVTSVDTRGTPQLGAKVGEALATIPTAADLDASAHNIGGARM